MKYEKFFKIFTTKELLDNPALSLSNIDEIIPENK